MRGKMLLPFLWYLLAIVFTNPVYAGPFDVYVETNYKNQPDLSKYGIKDPRIKYGQFLWKKGQDRNLLPSKDYVIAQTAKIKDHTGLLIVDIEHWPVTGSDAQVAASVKKLTTVLEWIKIGAPKTKVGYYWMIPVVGGYWSSQKGTDSVAYKKWQAKNDRVKPLADKVDAFFPTFYPVSMNTAAWVNYAVSGINECKRLGKGKPIYPFINTRFHPKSYEGLRFKIIPKDYVAFQLKTLKQSGTAGVVIWGLGVSKKEWSEDLPWWQASKEFLGLK